MSPQELLAHDDTARLWASGVGIEPGFDVAAAYQSALAARQLRQLRGEMPCGDKIRFTNRKLWPRYQVFAPIWARCGTAPCSFAKARARWT